MGSERAGTVVMRWRVVALTGTLALVLGGPVHVQAQDVPPSGRGWIWGGGISAGRLSFPGGENVALALGDVTGGLVIAGEVVEVRTGELVDSSQDSTDDATRLASLPSREPSAGFSFHVGYALSRRAALVLQAELVGGVGSGFSSAQGGLVLRVWPTSRLWLEAGPASGDLTYGSERVVVEEFADTGYGVRAGAGFTVLRRPGWELDVQGRFGTLSFDGFRATSVSVGLGASRRPR
jgi:hypothetical protein